MKTRTEKTIRMLILLVVIMITAFNIMMKKDISKSKQDLRNEEKIIYKNFINKIEIAQEVNINIDNKAKENEEIDLRNKVEKNQEEIVNKEKNKINTHNKKLTETKVNNKIEHKNDETNILTEEEYTKDNNQKEENKKTKLKVENIHELQIQQEKKPSTSLIEEILDKRQKIDLENENE